MIRRIDEKIEEQEIKFISGNVKTAQLELIKSMQYYEQAYERLSRYTEYKFYFVPVESVAICCDFLGTMCEVIDSEAKILLSDYIRFCMREKENEEMSDIVASFYSENADLLKALTDVYSSSFVTTSLSTFGITEENIGGKLSPIVKDIMKFFKSGEKDGENDIFGIVETRGENTQKHIMQPKKVKYKNRECDFYVYEPEVKEGNRIIDDKKQVKWEKSTIGKYLAYYPTNIRAKKDGKLASINSNITVVEFLSQDKTGTNEAFFNLTGGFAMPIADKDYKGQTGSPIGLKKDFEVRERYTEIIGELDHPYNYAGKRTGKNDRLDEDTLDKVTDRFNGHVTSAMELSPNLKPEDHLLVVPITSGGGQVGVDVTTNYLRNRCLANEGVEGYEDYKDGPNTILLLEKEDAACQLTEETKTEGFGEFIEDSKGNKTEIKYFDVAERTNMYITEHEELLKMAEAAGVNVAVVIITGTEDEKPISTGTRDGALELAEKYSDNVVAIQVPDSGHIAMVNGKQTWVGAVTDYVADRVIHNNVIEEYGEDVYNQACEELKSQGKDLDNMTSDELASELRGTADKISK